MSRNFQQITGSTSRLIFRIFLGVCLARKHLKPIGLLGCGGFGSVEQGGPGKKKSGLHATRHFLVLTWMEVAKGCQEPAKNTTGESLRECTVFMRQILELLEMRSHFRITRLTRQLTKVRHCSMKPHWLLVVLWSSKLRLVEYELTGETYALKASELSSACLDSQ